MPIGIRRINNTSHHPNDRIAFIKPLVPISPIAEDYLKRIAAIVYPLMKNHGMDIMSLNEFEPNREFLGRNWNAGECVELVLKDLTGNWLPFRFVLNTMLHELSHIQVMSHSKAFWNFYHVLRSEMKILLDKGYTGEGIYARGHSLSSNETSDHSLLGSDIPQVVCGGVYKRSRKRKKKIKDTTGIQLGADEDMRRGMEGKSHSAKPRVAKSKRGRDLRAAAAEMRGLEAEIERENEEDVSERVVDEQDQINKMRDEMRDILRGMEPNKCIRVGSDVWDLETSPLKGDCSRNGTGSISNQGTTISITEKANSLLKPEQTQNIKPDKLSSQIREPSKLSPMTTLGTAVSCHICTTLHQQPVPMICSICSCVLRPIISKCFIWQCKNSHCQSIGYFNHIDIGGCGLCGSLKR